ncbi:MULTISPECIES: hypothetical protein, partial [Pseudomonas syringae group]
MKQVRSSQVFQDRPTRKVGLRLLIFNSSLLESLRKGNFMSRRPAAAPHRYEFKKEGAFGVFKTNGSVPIEYFMTSFKVDDLTFLSYAKDVNTDLNFDYLIQRDIDEDRARAEISQYLAAKEGEAQKEIVFLPPLLVAVVGVDQNNRLGRRCK